MVITVVADNGGSSTIGQSWLETDLLWATLTAGSYGARYGAPLLSLQTLAFRTESSGLLDSASFLGGIAGFNSDGFGVGGYTILFDNVIYDSVGNFAVMLDPVSGADRLRFWSGPTMLPVQVPEPATLSLLGWGLLICALMRRRCSESLRTH